MPTELHWARGPWQGKLALAARPRGRRIVLHCRQGIGRTGLMAACLLITRGRDPETAIKEISADRGLAVPETDEQRKWIEGYAAALSGAH